MSEKEIEKLLAGLKEKVRPSKELNQRILADLNAAKKPGEEKGRFSNYEIILNQVHIMMTKWKMAIPVVFVVLVVAGLMIIRSGQKIQPTQEGSRTTGAETDTEYVRVPIELPIPQATGNIDDMIEAMTAFAENEQVITIEEGNDASMVTLDGQAISDFGQSYNENEF